MEERKQKITSKMIMDIDSIVKKDFFDLIPYGKRTQEIESMMRKRIALSKGEVNEIDYELNRKRRVVLDMQIKKLQDELQEIDDANIKFEEQKAMREEEKLAEEKEKLLKKKSCIHCDRVITDDVQAKKFDKGLVCQDCFDNFGKTDSQKWM